MRPTHHRLLSPVALAGWLATVAAAVGQAPATTAFTYQGQLRVPSGTLPATVNLDFRLFSAASGAGAQIGLPDVQNDVPLDANGLFTVTLNAPPASVFGPNTIAFNGEARWLEIRVNGQLLTPRQPLSAVPYAHYSLASKPGSTLDASDGDPAGAVFVDANGNIGIGITTPNAKVHIRPPIGESFSELRLTPAVNDGTTQIRLAESTGGSQATLLRHNGTGGENRFEVWSVDNGIELGPHLSINRGNGFVGIGGSADASRMLHLRGPQGVVRIDRRDDGGGTGIFLHQYHDNAGVDEPWKTFGLFVTGTGINAGQLAIADLGTAVSGGGTNRLLIDNSGNIGIGTSTPAQKLSVAGMVQSTMGGFMFPDGTTQATAATGGTGFWTGSGHHIFNNNSGNVGIGTGTPSDSLHVRHDQPSSTQLRIENRHDNAAANSGITLITGTTPPNIAQIALVDDALSIKNANRDIVLDTSTNVEFANGSELRVRFDLGGPNQAADLSLFSADGVTETVQLRAVDGTGPNMRFFNSAGTETIELDGSEGSNPRGGEISVRNAQGQATIVLDGDFEDSNVGRLITDVIQITGADLAEKFPVSDKPEPGTVVEIDPDNPGKLRTSREAYNRRVAGVVSGAGDLSVGALLGNLPGHDDAPPIALSGRVYVRCDASCGGIAPGDLLTTSGTPGHAMKVTDHARAQGAIIGKAMSGLTDGRGLVLALISLQ